MSDQWEELADEEYHRRPDTTPNKKPKPPKLQRRHSWAAASNGVIACKVCGTPIRDNWMTDCPGEPEPPKPCPCGDQGRPGHPSGWCREPEPPPNVAKKHHWTTPDANPDGPIICRYCEVLMTRENESEECKGQPPDVASEPGSVALLAAERRLLQCGEDHSDDIDLIGSHFAALRSENAALKAEEVKRREICLALQAQSQENRAEAVRMEAERDEACADAKSWEQQAGQRATELLAALKDNEKLREERDAAEAILLTLCSKGGPRTAGIWDDADAVVAAIKRRREEKGIHDPISKGRGER